jgi:lipoprotein NlpD
MEGMVSSVTSVISVARSFVVCALVAAITGGCATGVGAPVFDRTSEPRGGAVTKPAKPSPKIAPRPGDPRPEFHTVSKGDTLYSIALDHGLDHRELAQWNGITDPGVIRVGQQLRLRPPESTAAPLRGTPGVEGRPLGDGPVAAGSGVKTQPKAVRVPYSDQAYKQLAAVKPEPEARPDPGPAAGAAAGADGIQWAWPVSGKVVNSFNGTTVKGIGIAGKLGQPVLASAPGRVIFSGTATGTLGRLGKLIVIKHNETFVSVYAYNRELLVKEGQSVARGQRIAEMGTAEADQVKLHFEIRRFGNPVDPIKLLPPA